MAIPWPQSWQRQFRKLSLFPSIQTAPLPSIHPSSPGVRILILIFTANAHNSFRMLHSLFNIHSQQWAWWSSLSLSQWLISLLAWMVLLFERVEASCKTIRINADGDGWSSMDITIYTAMRKWRITPKTQLKLMMMMSTRSPCQIIVYINSNKITLSHIPKLYATHQGLDTKQNATKPSCYECI